MKFVVISIISNLFARLLKTIISIVKEPIEKHIAKELKLLNDPMAEKISETFCFLHTLGLRYQNFINDEKPKFYSDKESIENALYI